MTILDSVIEQLSNGEPKTLEQVLNGVPELLSEPNRTDVLYLLLRLNCCVRVLPDGRWTLAVVKYTPVQRVVTSAQAYLDTLTTPGAMLHSVVEHVVKETNYESGLVRPTLQQNFVIQGKLLLNKRKEKG